MGTSDLISFHSDTEFNRWLRIKLLALGNFFFPDQAEKCCDNEKDVQKVT